MRKTSLFGATMLALSTGAWSLTALAQTGAPAAAPAAPMAAPAPEASPAPAAPDTSAPAATTPDTSAPDTSAPAKPMTSKKHMTHKMGHGHGKLVATKAGDKAVDDLNSASLDSAKSGKPFTAPATPEAAKKTAHEGDKGTSTKHHHAMHKAKKAAASADSTAAPAASPDAASSPPADSTGK